MNARFFWWTPPRSRTPRLVRAYYKCGDYGLVVTLADRDCPFYVSRFKLEPLAPLEALATEGA